MLRVRRACRGPKLHHAATGFIALLALAHILSSYWSIQYEEVWIGLSPAQKLLRVFRVLLVDTYMPRTKADNRGSCPVADHISKVALLFLAVPDGDLPHEAAWRSWFTGAEGLLPVTQMMQGGLPPQLGLCAKALANSRGNPIRRQWLFTAYVHRPPGATPLPRLHAFHGYELKNTVKAAWGMHSAVTAARALLSAALQEPTNTHFQLLSAATLPLWPPTVVYQRVMAETRSHTDACNTQAEPQGRWAAEAGGQQPAVPNKLRRSSQYFTLTRQHAWMAANDSTLEPQFARACTDDQDHDFRQITCSSDEFYVPTLLATAGLEQQSTCHGSVVQDNWSASSPVLNRTQWAVADITAANLAALRNNRGRCSASAVIRSAKQDFQPIGALAAIRRSGVRAADDCGLAAAAISGPGACFLFARRFPADTAQAVLEVLHDVGNSLSIVESPLEYDPRTRRRGSLSCGEDPPG